MKISVSLIGFKKVNYIHLFLLAIILSSCTGKQSSSKPDFFLLTSSLEEISGDFFITKDSVRIHGAKNVSNDFSRTGKSSIKLNSKSPYGLDFKFENVKKGDVIKASVWRKSKNGQGTITITDGPGNSKQFIMSEGFILREKNWELIQCSFVAREDYKKIKIYVYTASEESVYFDDLKIEMYSNNSKPDNTYDALEIKIDSLNYNTLSLYRDSALKKNVISKDEKKYVEATISIDGVEVPVSIRLKGDWTDHLTTNKWSFRIKLKGDTRFNGLKTFSIQNPSTRSFMKEWFAHKLFEKEDVLTTSYSFIPVIINGVKMGVYALEEHFDKQLLESRNRREAPILKFDESSMWEQIVYGNQHNVYSEIPNIPSANIVPFKKNRTYKSPELYRLFKLAQAQMNDFRNSNPHVESYLNIDAAAKYLALCDILNGKHGLVWHNQRFYINPINSKLEPIGFDCFGEHSNDEGDIIGLEKVEKYRLFQSALQNQTLSDSYEIYLKRFSKIKYLEEVFEELKLEILELEKLFHFEDPSYRFDKEYFVRHSKQIRKQLSEYRKFKEKQIKKSPLTKNYSVLQEDLIYKETALKAYKESKDSLHTTVVLRNYHLAGIKIIGYGIKRNEDSIISVSAVNLSKFNSGFPKKKLVLKGNVKQVFYTADNCEDKVFSSSVIKWGVPGKIDFKTRQLPNFIQSITGTKEFIIKAGSYKVLKDIIVPNGYLLRIDAGAELNFINGAAFISYSPVNLIGDSLHPIVIRSSDSSANGFSVIASGTESNLKHVQFSQFKSLNREHKNLTGAVMFYESKVNIDDCLFSDNYSEDALNLIRCEFKIQNSIIENTFSDGFDADFCTGSVINCVFKNTGNDGVDFSGSKIDIEKCLIENAADKAISGGENSILKIVDCKINRANIAIAAKDLSMLEVRNVSITNCNYSYAAYRKKPEYGPATITVYSAKLNDSKNLYLLEKGSELTYLGKKHVGNKTFDIDSMYSQYK